MPVTTIALPQDPSSPSGRNTVIYMVRNKNNLEDLRLRRRIEEFNKQLGFRVKNHDFEKLDTYEFLRQLKDCDSDKMSHFRDIQDSIRAMPTPDSMDVVNFSSAIQSLNLAICGQKTELPLLKKNVTNNSKSKMAKEEGEKLPNIIKRAKTDPSLNYSLLQTKVSRTGSVFKAPTPAWKPSAVPPKEPVKPDLNDELLMPHALSVSNRKMLSASRKSVYDVTTELDALPVPEPPDKPAVKKSVRVISGKTKLSTRDKGYSSLLGKELTQKEKEKEMSRKSHGRLDISDTLLKKLTCVNQYQSQTSKGTSEFTTPSEGTTPLVFVDDTGASPLHTMSPDAKPSHLVPRKAKDTPDTLVSAQGTHLKSPPILSHSTSFARSISISNRSLLDRKVPQKMSLPILLSLGLGELKNPKKYRYAGIQYAKTIPRSSDYRKEEVPKESEAESDFDESDFEEEDEGQTNVKRRGRPKYRKPVEARMQNFFVEVDKLVEKPEKILVF